ncbi:MAG: type II methionyl aminopeptidase [Candidatus Pacearchaeota archaeon]|nr:type II methionyl aminopeptidase [Candidatus Pacearchaeota archaeon]
MDSKELDKWREAGKIGTEALAYAKSIVKQGMSLLELAEKTEKYIQDRKASFAFPINLSKDEIAAHSTPQQNDEEIAEGLLKMDLGVSLEGYISDLSCTVDLTKEKKYTKLIEASQKALDEAIKLVKPGMEIGKIGKKIQETISSYGFAPVVNLSGHELQQWNLHAGLTIPNFDNNSDVKLKEGMVLAIEPFATTGQGMIQDGKPSGIYKFLEKHSARDPLAKEILAFIEQEYHELPFSSRWIVKKFGTRALFSLRALEQAQALHHFKQLVEKTKAPVSQAEATVLVTKEGCEVLAR